MTLKLLLLSPAGSEPLCFIWPLSSIRGLVETIRFVGYEFPNLQKYIEELLLGSDEINTYDQVRDLCNKYNNMVNSRTIGCNLKTRDRPQPRQELLRHIMSTVYNITVTKPADLNKCKTGCSETYGEVLFDTINEIIDNLDIKDNETFIDFGSGVGTVVFQVAASTKCKLCIGIERRELPYHYSKEMDSLFRTMVRWFGKFHQEYVLLNMDFLSEELRTLISSADKCFANNMRFESDVNYKLQNLFLTLKNGSRVISSIDFVPKHFSINERTMSSFAAIVNTNTLKPFTGEVSWTNRVTFYPYIIDRRNLEQFLESHSKIKVSRSTKQHSSMHQPENLETAGSSVPSSTKHYPCGLSQQPSNTFQSTLGNYKCNCGAMFLTKHYLYVHISYKNDNKPKPLFAFKCSLCSDKFIVEEFLIAHMKQHQ